MADSTTHAETMETMSIGLAVGGSIVIPHLRRAVAFLDEMEAKKGRSKPPRNTAIGE